ncbi:MAG TPA: methylmalonyl Co-A mutase-associated GTPase MeaB [Candidatus Binatia bacterium]|nr:methylmalonyl Co-A mutase-associated GTPase MeaB [Candidatus Binatia bacterium]
MTGNLKKRILDGDVRALASVLSLIENGDPKVKSILRAIYPHTGRAHVIGVTGAAGTGKSTLIDRMTAEFRRRKKSVGILAVDPTSLFSSGALLGDRIRMRDHFADDGVFIRSFATRGGSGGLSSAVRQAIHLLDAAGKDVIFVETIGVGQDQLEIAALAHMVVVVLTPQRGDEVQDMKAGLTEIADILVVNKADLPGADETVQQLKALFGEEDFHILAASAIKDRGIDALVDRIQELREKSFDNGNYQTKRLHLCRQELLSLLREKVFAKLARKIADGSFEAQVKRIAEGEIDPYSAADKLARRINTTRLYHNQSNISPQRRRVHRDRSIS